MVVLLVNQTPYTSSYGPRYLPQAMGSVTEALSGVSDRIRILLYAHVIRDRVGKGLSLTPYPRDPHRDGGEALCLRDCLPSASPTEATMSF